MPNIHLIEGPIGAGKSTFSTSLAIQQSGVHIALDEWFAVLFSEDRSDTDFLPWYIERKSRCLELIWKHTRQIMASGTDAILELGLIQQQSRQEFYGRMQSAGFDFSVYVLDASRDIRRERVQRRNLEKGPTFSMVVPDNVFEMASDLWEAPDEIESMERAIQFISTVPSADCDG